MINDMDNIIESRVPLGTIIESIHTDMNASILLTLETFELESCIGAAKVVSEGANPVIVMEGAVRNFLDTIIQKLKDFISWIKSIFKKIKGKFDSSYDVREAKDLRDYLTGSKKSVVDGKTFDEHMKQIVLDAKSSEGSVKEKALSVLGIENGRNSFRVINVNDGIPYAEKLNDWSKNIIDGVIDSVDEMCNVSKSVTVKHFKVKGVSIERLQDIIQFVGKSVGSDFNSKEDIIEAIKEKFNCSDKSKGIDTSGVKASELMPFIESYASGNFFQTVSTTYDYVDKNATKCLKRLQEYQRELQHSKVLNGDANSVSRLIATHINFLNATSSLCTSICACIQNIFTGGFGQYKIFIHAVMNYRTESAATESYFYDYNLFENFDTDDGPVTSSNIEEGIVYPSTLGSMLSSYIGSYVGL